MADRSLRLRLGVFMGASLIALAGLVVLFGGAPRLFSNNANYAILFPEAPGIAPGTPIRKSGVRIGEVTGMTLDPQSGMVRVQIAVDRTYLPRKTEEANITRGLLSGDTAIDFLPQLGPDGQPIPPGEHWPPGSEIPGVPPITARTLLNQASLASFQQSLDRITRAFEKLENIQNVGPKLETAADEATGLFRDIRAFIPELRKTNTRLQNLIGPTDEPAPPRPKVGPIMPVGLLTAAAQPPPPGEPNLRDLIRDAQESLRGIRPAVEDLRAAVRRIEPELTALAQDARRALAGVNDVLSPENRRLVNEALRNFNGVTANIIRFTGSLSVLLDQAEKMVKNIDAQVSAVGLIVGDVRAVTKPLAARSEGIVATVEESALELNKLIADIRGVVGAFAKQDGTLQKLLADPDVYQNLDAAASSVARITARAEKITRDLEVFADKIARRPELIGIGGALRPSAGLKDLPGTPTYRPDWPPATGAKHTHTPHWLPPPQGAPPPVQGQRP
jgi:phospholipid/cholesterol/gamma-HCH transport system substrate-binding protein